MSDAITEFLLNDLIGQADIRSSTDRELTVAQALDRASDRIDERFADLPIVETEVRRLIGRTYQSLAKSDQAEPHLLRSIELYSQHLGAEHLDTLHTREELGVLLSNSSRDARGA